MFRNDPRSYFDDCALDAVIVTYRRTLTSLIRSAHVQVAGEARAERLIV